MKPRMLLLLLSALLGVSLWVLIASWRSSAEVYVVKGAIVECLVRPMIHSGRTSQVFALHNAVIPESSGCNSALKSRVHSETSSYVLIEATVSDGVIFCKIQGFRDFEPLYVVFSESEFDLETLKKLRKTG